MFVNKDQGQSPGATRGSGGVGLGCGGTVDISDPPSDICIHISVTVITSVLDTSLFVTTAEMSYRDRNDSGYCPNWLTLLVSLCRTWIEEELAPGGRLILNEEMGLRKLKATHI